MATLATIPLQYYDYEKDEYHLPDGRVIAGFRVRDARRQMQDQIDAARGYDPYNHNRQR